jgi:hypothetical protein
MKTSESIKTITPAFLEAQKKIKVAVKNAENNFFHNKYADLSAVIDACKKQLNDNGISVMQPIDGMSVETILIHTSGEWMSSLTPIVCKSQNDPQALGSAISYSRRYGLQSMVLIPADDDDGNSASQVKGDKPKADFCAIHNKKMSKLIDSETNKPFIGHWTKDDKGQWVKCLGKVEDQIL